MSRCWVLKFAIRNSIPSYYVGMYRRFCKSACEEAWKRESIALKRWLSLEEVCTLFDIDEEVIFALAALHRIRVKRHNKSQVYNKVDILTIVKKEGTLCLVTLKYRNIAQGKMKSIYLEFNPTIHDIKGNCVRYECLNLEIYTNPENSQQFKHNRAVEEIAETIRCERYLQLVRSRLQFLG